MVEPNETGIEFFDRAVASKMSVRAVAGVLEDPPEHWTVGDLQDLMRFCVAKLLRGAGS